MSGGFYKYVLVFVLLGALINITELALQHCENCIPIKECATYINLLEKTKTLPAKHETFQLLRTKQCGFKDGYPKICCSETPAKPATLIRNNETCKMNSTCTIIKDCNPYMNLIASMEKPLGKPVVSFLRSQECGFQDGFPKVCCTLIPSSFQTVKHARPLNRGKFNKLSASVPIEIPTTRKSTTTTTRRHRILNRRVNKGLQEKMEALNSAFSSDDFDLSFDLMLRKREKRYDSDSFVEIEIR